MVPLWWCVSVVGGRTWIPRAPSCSEFAGVHVVLISLLFARSRIRRRLDCFASHRPVLSDLVSVCTWSTPSFLRSGCESAAVFGAYRDCGVAFGCRARRSCLLAWGCRTARVFCLGFFGCFVFAGEVVWFRGGGV